jgi:sulfur-oxidizing protein SoxX
MKGRWPGKAAREAVLAVLLPGATLAASAGAAPAAASGVASDTPPKAVPASAAPAAASSSVASDTQPHAVQASAGLAAARYVVVADGIPAPLVGAAAGNVTRGRAIVANRQLGLCLLCHTGPIPEERFQGNLAPALEGAGSRWTVPQLRLRIADASHVNPATIMPSFFKTDGLNRVASAYAGQTILNAQQIEDVVAWLQTLKEPAP